MQSEEQVRHVRAELPAGAELLPQHADTEPHVQPSTRAPRKRLTTRQLAKRRRQRLHELMQRQPNQQGIKGVLGGQEKVEKLR